MDYLIDTYKTPLNIDWKIEPPLVGRFKVMDLECELTHL